MTFYVNFWEVARATISSFRKTLGLLSAFRDDFPRIAPQKYLSNEVYVRILLIFSIGKMPRRIEGFREGKVLLCDYAP